MSRRDDEDWRRLMARIEPDRNMLAATEGRLSSAVEEPLDPAWVRDRVDAILASEAAQAAQAAQRRRRRRLATAIVCLCIAVSLAFGTRTLLVPANVWVENFDYPRAVGVLRDTAYTQQQRNKALMAIARRMELAIDALGDAAADSAQTAIAQRADQVLHQAIAAFEMGVERPSPAGDGDWESIAALAAYRRASVAGREHAIERLGAMVVDAIHVVQQFPIDAEEPERDLETGRAIVLRKLADRARRALADSGR